MAEQPASSSPWLPSSPGVSPARLSDCIEDLLYFTLSTYLQEMSPDLGLSSDYCSRLLQLDEAQPLTNLSTGNSLSAPPPPWRPLPNIYLNLLICCRWFERNSSLSIIQTLGGRSRAIDYIWKLRPRAASYRFDSSSWIAEREREGMDWADSG